MFHGANGPAQPSVAEPAGAGSSGPGVPLEQGVFAELIDGTERYPSLFAFSSDAIALYRPDGTIAAGNAVSRKLVGAGRDELLGAHFSTHTGTRERERVEAFFRSALSGEPVEFETVFQSVDGRPVNVIARLVPALVGTTVAGVFGIARDITAQRVAETARDRSRQEFQSLFDHHPDSITMIDDACRYVRINPAAEQLLSYRSEEVEGKEAGLVLPPEERAENETFLREAKRSEDATRYRRTLLRKDGSRLQIEGTAVPIVVDGRSTGLFLISRDVAERGRLEAAFALAARRTRALYRLAAEIGADPGEQVGSALAFGAEQLGFETAYVVALDGEGIAVERSVGAASPVDPSDPAFVELCRETIAGSGVFDLDEASLARRASRAGATGASWGSFVGLPLDIGSERYGALAFAGVGARPPLDRFDREFAGAVAELAAVSLERARRQQHLVGLAHSDALTGLPNRLLLRDRFEQALAQAGLRGESFAVHFIDLDGFKAVNDTLGHKAGDEVLRLVAERLRTACREGDTVARLGGDEFVVVQAGPRAEERSEGLARRLLAKLAAPCEIEGVALKLSAAIGISVFPHDGRDEATLLESADGALYAAKRAGPGTIRRFDSIRPTPETGTAAPAAL